MSWRGHVVKINKNCTGLPNENQRKKKELDYLTPIPVFLRKLFSSQQCIKHAKVHLLHRKNEL